MNDEEIKKLVESYRPSDACVRAMSKVKLVATVGPSATGKNTIMKALAAAHAEVHFVVGETSRAPRVGERDGVDLHFRKKEDILEDMHVGNLTQIVTGPNGDLYCTHVDNFPPDKINVFPLIPRGVQQFRALPLAFFEAAFIVPASFETWQQWLARQAEISNWSEEKLHGRLDEAKQSFEFALNDPDIKFVLNDEVKKAAGRLYQIASGQKPDDEELARTTAEENYQKLKDIINP